jgi:alpha-glucosidase
MKKIVTMSRWDFYSITLDNLSEGDLIYFFEFSDGVTSEALGSETFGKKETVQLKPFESKLQASLNNPEWPYDAIWYEIFLDRFRNSKISNNSTRTINATQWPDESELKIGNQIYGWSADQGESEIIQPQSKLTKEARAEQEKIYYLYKENLNNLSYGGDIQGLIDSLPYLKDLGINALYLTPIFVGRKAHHYHTLDPRHIDDSFGYKDSYHKLGKETNDHAT